jgi:hypothetical protein
VGKVSWDFVQSWKPCIEPEEEEQQQQQQQHNKFNAQKVP